MLTIHAPTAEDFASQGLGALLPSEALVEEEAGGMYELKLVQPITGDGRDLLIDVSRIIRTPAPIRETPLVQIGNAGTTVTRYIYEVDVNSRLMLRAKPSTSSKVLGKYKDKTKVVKIGESGDWYQVIVKSGGATGWMHKSYLDFVGTETETIVGDAPGAVIEPRQTREQLFRVYQVKRSNTKKTVEVLAQHITYDLKGVIIGSTYAPKGVAADTVCAQLIALGDHAHDFNIICTCTDLITADYTGRSVLECLLDPDDGVVAQCGARLVRDNYDIFILPDEDRELGVELRYAKNLLEAEIETDAGDVITRIRPVGKKKNGDPLYITDNGGYVDSPNAGDYPVVYAKEIEYEVQVGVDGIATETAARTKLAELAAAEFSEKGADAPAVKLDADFVRLELTEEYKALANQNALHLYDTAKVVDGDAGIYATLRMTGYEFDALLERYTRTDLGELVDLEPTVYGYDIAGGTLSGTRIINGTLDAALKLRNLSVNYGKFDVAAVEQLMAESITALQARIGTIIADTVTTDELYVALANVVVLMVQQITAGTITTDALYAELARIITLRVQQITAETTTTDTLYAALANVIVLRAEEAQLATAEVDDLRAALAEIVKLDAKLADIDYAKIMDLIAEEAIFSNGTAGQLYINRLAVTQANLLNATINRLVMPGGDGKYYAIVVGSDGVLHTEEVTVTAGEIAAGELGDGRQISATTINAGSINGQTVSAQSAIINTILTTALTAEQITAGEALIASATIPTLYTTSIEAIGNSLTFSANERITMIAEAAAGAQAVAENAASLILTPEQIKAEVFASTEYGTLSTTVTQTATGLSSVQTKQTEIDGRVQTIEESVVIDGSTITIGKSDVPVQNIINETGFSIKEVGGSELAYVREGKMGAQRLLLEDALIIGGAALKDMNDGHVLLLKYGG